MKKSAIALLLFLIAESSIAQKCQYLTNKVSGMDGTRLVITQPLMLSGNFNDGTLEIWSTLSGDSAIIIAFEVKNKLLMDVHKNDSITVTLESGESIFIPVLQDAATVCGEKNKLTIMTMIGKSTILKLESSPMRNISIPVNLGELSGTPGNKKQAGSIQKAISCVKGFITADRK
jgi:hypothetical protein